MKKIIATFLAVSLLALPCSRAQWAAVLAGSPPSGASAPNPDVLWWKLNAGTGTTALTPEVGGAFSHNADWVTGKSGSGYALDFTAANSDHAQSDAGVTYGSPSEITVCFWTYLDNNSTAAMLVESSSNAPGNAGTYWFYLDGSGGLSILIGGASNYTLKHATAPSTGAWFHVTGTFNFTTGDVAMYYDGAAQSLTTDSGGFSGATTAANWQVFVGARNAGASLPMDGKIDDVRIYSYTLSGAQITAVKNDPQ